MIAHIREYTKEFTGAKFVGAEKPWGVECDYAFPCATQNEVDAKGADQLVKGGCKGVFEGVAPTLR